MINVEFDFLSIFSLKNTGLLVVIIIEALL